MDNKRYDRIADLNESNRLMRQSNQQLRAELSSKDAEINHLQAENEALRARVAELEEALIYLREPWELSKILGSDTYRRVVAADVALSGDRSKGFILRKQADAVEPAIRTALRNLGNACISEDDIVRFASGYADHLRQQADEIEREGSGDV